MSRKAAYVRHVTLLLLLACGGFSAVGDPERVVQKTGTASGRLLIPLFTVDTNDPAGTTTLFAVRNESTEPINLVVSYFETDNGTLPQLQEEIPLIGKEVVTVDIRSKADELSASDGVSRGFVIIEPEAGGAVIQGDYFLLNDGEAFASGYRMLNIDPASSHNDLCTRFSLRYLDSSILFDSGTIFTVWMNLTAPPSGPPDSFAYSVYDNTGGDPVFSTTYQALDIAFEVSAADLRDVVMIPTSEFGVVELEFPQGVVGHVSVRMSAFGRFSVGIEATCLD